MNGQPLPSGKEDPWISVRDVAEELSLGDRAVWELIKRTGMPVLNGHGKIRNARFRRSAWEAARDAATKPVPPRAPARKSYEAATAAPSATQTVAPTKSMAERLAEIRKIRPASSSGR